MLIVLPCNMHLFNSSGKMGCLMFMEILREFCEGRSFMDIQILRENNINLAFVRFLPVNISYEFHVGYPQRPWN